MQYQIPCGTTGIRTIFSRYLTKAEKGRQAYRRSTRTDRRVTLWNVSEQPEWLHYGIAIITQTWCLTASRFSGNSTLLQETAASCIKPTLTNVGTTEEVGRESVETVKPQACSTCLPV